MRSPRLTSILIASLIAAVVSAGASVPTVSAFSIEAEADAWVDPTQSPPAGSGTGDLFITASGDPQNVCTPIRIVYARFNLQGVTTSVSGAKLTLEITLASRSNTGKMRVYGAAGAPADTWAEDPFVPGSLPSPTTGILAEADIPASGFTGPLTFSESGTALSTFLETERTAPSDGKATLVIKIDSCTFGSAAYRAADRLNASFSGPLSTEMESIDAIPGNGKVTLSWQTASELDNAGFNVYRSTDSAGDYTLLTEQLIPPRGNASTGASYSFDDSAVTNGTTYYYIIERLGTQGDVRRYGPLAATPRLSGKGR